jgi:DNA-binding transcriptional MerR regulator
MLRISEFARTTNVTVRTLRFYDQVDLLRPAHVSLHTGYRGYSPAQIAELSRIQAYKDMGFALDEIRDLLKRPPGPGELERILHTRRKVLCERVREDRGKLARIEARLSSLDHFGTPDPLVLFGKTPRQWVVSAREKLNKYDEADALLADVERRVDKKVLSEGRATIWHSCAESDGRIDCEALCFVKAPIVAGRGLKAYALAPTSIAFAYHYGSEESISRTYESIAASLERQGYRLAAPKREVYWPTAGSRGEPRLLTEVQFPIARARGFAAANAVSPA